MQILNPLKFDPDDIWIITYGLTFSQRLFLGLDHQKWLYQGLQARCEDTLSSNKMIYGSCHLGSNLTLSLVFPNLFTCGWATVQLQRILVCSFSKIKSRFKSNHQTELVIFLILCNYHWSSHISATMGISNFPVQIWNLLKTSQIMTIPNGAGHISQFCVVSLI